MPAPSLSRPLLALAALASVAAAAPTPYPASADLATLRAWTVAQTKIKPETVVVAGPDSIFAVEPMTGDATTPGGRRIRLRQEVVRPSFAAVLGGRSAMLELDVDCAGRKVMRLGLDVYAAPNLGGAVDRLGASRTWTPADAGTALSDVIDGACDPLAPRPFDKTPAVAQAPPPPPPARAAAAVGLRGTVSAEPLADLGDYDSPEAAEAAWREAAKAAPEIAGRSPRLELAGTRFRALVDGFASKAQAEALCQTLAKAGHACRVRG